MPTVRASLAILAALTATAAVAADPVRLAKDDVEKLLPGRTLTYTNPNGTAVLVAFLADGRATYKQGGGREALGAWTVGDDGRYCIKFTTGNVQDHCRTLWKTDAGMRLRSATNEFLPVGGLD
jgi:hypothetical protein